MGKTAVTIGAIGLIVVPILLGPIALVLGLVAQTNRNGGREAGTAIALGLLDIVIGVAVWMWLANYL